MKDIFDDMPFSDLNRSPEGYPYEQTEDCLSIEEREELRLLLVGARAAFADEDNEIKPDPRIHKNLRALVSARKKKVGWISLPVLNLSKFLNFQVPAYQVAMASILIFIAAVFIGRKTGTNDNPNTVIVYKTDTIFEKTLKKPGAISVSKDSQAPILVPLNSGGLYSDSIDMNDLENNSVLHDDTPPLLAPFPWNRATPRGSSKMQSPDALDTPVRSSMLLEDTSIWNRELRG